MEDIESLSHHSLYESSESNFTKCLTFLINLEYGKIRSILNVFLSFACVVIYVYTTYQPNVVLINSNIFFYINFSCRCFFALIVIFDIILGKYEFNLSGISSLILDFLSIFPYLLSRTTVGMKENLISKTHLITSSFICLRLFKIKSLSKCIHSNVNRKLFSIILFLICLIIVFTILVNVIENTLTIGNYFLFLPRDCINTYFCKGTNDTLHSTLFFIMVTIGIVGYNSIITSNLGKIIISIIIIFGLYEIPLQLSKLISLLSSKRIYQRATYKILKDVEFILISGNVSYGTISALLKEYFHPDHGENEKHCLLLIPKSPDNDMEELLQLYKNKLFYIEGDPLKFNDLQRCQFKQASMIMILCNKQAADSSAEDSKTIFMAMAIKNYFSMGNNNNDDKHSSYQTNKLLRANTLPNFEVFKSNFLKSNNKKEKEKDIQIDEPVSSKLIIQLLKPESEHNFSLLTSGRKSEDQIVCIDQLKISLLAKSCLCKGIISLISNLVITSNFDESAEEHLGKLNWMEEYKKGKDYEIYKIPLDYMRGYKFSTVVDKIYNEKKTITFGLNIEDKITNKNVVLLSPMDFILPESREINIYGYLLAKDQGDADEVKMWEKTIKKSIFMSHGKSDFFMKKIAREAELGEIIEDEVYNFTRDKRKLNGDKASLGNICHITTEYIDKNDVTIDSVDKMPVAKDHIIICGICHNLIDLIKPLRSKKLPKSILPTIVILSKELPDEKLWSTISYFEHIYLVQGDAMEKSDLKRAGIRKAKHVIILAPSINEISHFTESQNEKSEQNTSSEDEDDSEKNNETIERKNLSKEEEILLDSQTIFKYNQISKINKNIFCVIELINPKNVLFLNNHNRRNNDEYTFIKSGLYIDATVSFAAGEVYYSNIMDNIITQAYYNPSLLSVLKKLIVGDEVENNLKKENVINKYSNVPSGSLYLIDLPLSLFKKEEQKNTITFQKVFNSLLQKKIIVIGVYRYGSLTKKFEKEKEILPSDNANMNSKNSFFYYVVTAPEHNFVLNLKDKLFIISPEYPLPETFEENVSEDKDDNMSEDDNNIINNTHLRNNEISKKEIDEEELENKLINFNYDLEKTKSMIDDIENCINKITNESSTYIKNSIKKKLYEIKNEKY